ncbi:CD209 antigen-like protein E isoform X1 [Ostrea edulis]|uniref:CD209 antigen-like protein E isoform X1 n=1 Tax=Ostrea edulis TaxID=37623 RepID=UPI0024AF45FE|nr:CD209 antigen-like protein E isoform X1 [Ostrea edulis]
MFDLGLQTFCTSVVLTIVKIKHTAAFQYGCGTSFERDMVYDSTVPNDEYFYINSFTGLDIIRCFSICHRERPNCVGLLYNGEQMKCKLLQRNLNETNKDVNATKDEWEYFRKIRRTGECCEDDWTPYINLCYRYSNTKLSWDDAKTACEDQNAYLVQLETAEETSWLLTTMLPNVELVNPFDHPTWVGATDREVEGTFKWIVGYGDITSLPWYGGQPDNAHGGQDCLTVMRSAQFDDFMCAHGLVFVCEKQQPI